MRRLHVWRDGDPVRARRVFCVTLGTVFPLESGDLYPRLLAAVRALPIDAVVTVGREVDPARFGPQPSGIAVERHVPLAAVLPSCDAVVSHGGSGTVLATLAHGLPTVMLSLGASQPLHATRCAAAGSRDGARRGGGVARDRRGGARRPTRAVVSRGGEPVCATQLAAMPAPEDVLPLLVALERR